MRKSKTTFDTILLPSSRRGRSSLFQHSILPALLQRCMWWCAVMHVASQISKNRSFYISLPCWMTGTGSRSQSDWNGLKVYLLIGQCWSSLNHHTSPQPKSCAVPLFQTMMGCRDSSTGWQKPMCLWRPWYNISHSFVSHGSLFPVRTLYGLHRHQPMP